MYSNFQTNKMEIINISPYKKQFAIKTEQKYDFAFSLLPELYSTDIYLQAIELIATETRLAYETKLLAKFINPYASSPNFPTTKGDNQKLINIWTPSVISAANIFIKVALLFFITYFLNMSS